MTRPSVFLRGGNANAPTTNACLASADALHFLGDDRDDLGVQCVPGRSDLVLGGPRLHQVPNRNRLSQLVEPGEDHVRRGDWISPERRLVPLRQGEVVVYGAPNREGRRRELLG
jgi:hypothetical protein